jgi:hypothetical protein
MDRRLPLLLMEHHVGACFILEAAALASTKFDRCRHDAECMDSRLSETVSMGRLALIDIGGNFEI